MNVIQKIIQSKEIGSRKKRRAIKGLLREHPLGFKNTAITGYEVWMVGGFLELSKNYNANYQKVGSLIDWYASPEGHKFWRRLDRKGL